MQDFAVILRQVEENLRLGARSWGKGRAGYGSRVMSHVHAMWRMHCTCQGMEQWNQTLPYIRDDSSGRGANSEQQGGVRRMMVMVVQSKGGSWWWLGIWEVKRFEKVWEAKGLREIREPMVVSRWIGGGTAMDWRWSHSGC